MIVWRETHRPQIMPTLFFFFSPEKFQINIILLKKKVTNSTHFSPNSSPVILFTVVYLFTKVGCLLLCSTHSEHMYMHMLVNIYSYIFCLQDLFPHIWRCANKSYNYFRMKLNWKIWSSSKWLVTINSSKLNLAIWCISWVNKSSRVSVSLFNLSFVGPHYFLK